MSIEPLFKVVTLKLMAVPELAVPALDVPILILPLLVRFTLESALALTTPETFKPVREIAPVVVPVVLNVSAPAVKVALPVLLMPLPPPVVVRAKELEPELEVSRLTEAGTLRLTLPVVLALRLRVELAGIDMTPLAIDRLPEPEARFSVPLFGRVNVVADMVPEPPAVRSIVCPCTVPALMPAELLSENVPLEALLVAEVTVTVLAPLLLRTNTLPPGALMLRVDAAVEIACVLSPMLPEDVPAVSVTDDAVRVPTPVLFVIEPVVEPPRVVWRARIPPPAALTFP